MNAIAMIDVCIADHEAKLLALRTARALLAGDDTATIRLQPGKRRQLPAPAAKKTKTSKAGKNRGGQAMAAETFFHTIENTDVEVTEQQQAVLELLAANEYTPRQTMLPLFDNSMSACTGSLNDLKRRMEAAKCPAVIRSYNGPGRGYRLEKAQ
jgi:hypothetical protein